MDPAVMILIVLASLLFLYAIARKAFEHEAQLKRLKLEADLKKSLAEHIQDPDAIERILKLEGLGGGGKPKPGDELTRKHLELQAKALEQVQQRMEERQAGHVADRNDPDRTSRRYVFPGLICMFLGAVFVLADQLALSPDAQGMSFPGVVVFAVGFAMMSYSVWLQDTARRERSLTN